MSNHKLIRRSQGDRGYTTGLILGWLAWELRQASREGLTSALHQSFKTNWHAIIWVRVFDFYANLTINAKNRKNTRVYQFDWEMTKLKENSRKNSNFEIVQFNNRLIDIYVIHFWKYFWSIFLKVRMILR